MFKMAQKEVMEQGSRKLDVTKLHPLSPEIISRQPTINIGLIGHVAHGKTTMVRAISGIQTTRFKCELERNITVKLGYANAKIYKCEDESCPRPLCYKSYGSGKEDNPPCDVPGFDNCKMKLLRHISFVDCPGHEILMTRMLSGATVMDGAFLLIAANESCPQPQMQEHLSAVDILKLQNIIVLQNKVDTVPEDQARNQYKAIRGFLKGVLKVNQIVELRPGIIGKNAHGKTICKPIYSRIMSLFAEQNKLQFAVPGGLIGVGTSMDPALSRSDMLVGQVLGDVGTLPEVYIKLKIRKIELLRQLVGVEKNDSGQKVSSLVKGEVLMLNILSMATGAKIITVRKDCATLELTAPVCTGIAEKVVLSRRVGGHWRLIGWGEIEDGVALNVQLHLWRCSLSKEIMASIIISFAV